MKLTKRQNTILSEYGTDDWLTVLGVDYSVVMNLVKLQLLEYDHVKHKVRLGKNSKPFSYTIVIVHENIPNVFWEDFEVSHPDEMKNAAKKIVYDYCKKYSLYVKDCYVEVNPIERI